MKSHILVAVLALAGAAAASPAFGDDHPSLSEVDRILTESVPITITTDKDSYDHKSVIEVFGTVSNAARGTQVTLQVISPLGSVVTVDQLEVTDDGTYEAMLNTSGDLWKYDGTYTIRVQYGAQAVNNKALVELTGGTPTSATRGPPAAQCTAGELSAGGYCIPYSIDGSTVTGASLNPGESVVVMVDPFQAGTLTISPSRDVFRDFTTALVDGEMSDDVEVSGNDITVSFPAGTEKIEFYGAFVIPEFGAVALVVLAVAVVAIVAVTARSRLALAPRY